MLALLILLSIWSLLVGVVVEQTEEVVLARVVYCKRLALLFRLVLR